MLHVLYSPTPSTSGQFEGLMAVEFARCTDESHPAAQGMADLTI